MEDNSVNQTLATILLEKRGHTVIVAGEVRRLREGIELDDGPTAPARVAVVAPTLLRIVIHEGRNRQIRRMCDAVGHPVVRLVRTRIGPLADPSLGPGAYRPLTFDEVRSLAAAALPTGGEVGPVPPLDGDPGIGSSDGPE